MSTANRKRRAMRRNPTRFLVDNIVADSPLEKAFRKRFQKKNWLATYGKNKFQRMIGINFWDPWDGVSLMESMAYVDHEGVHIVR